MYENDYNENIQPKISEKYPKLSSFPTPNFWDAPKISFQPNNHVALQDWENCQVFRHPNFWFNEKIGFHPSNYLALADVPKMSCFPTLIYVKY